MGHPVEPSADSVTEHRVPLLPAPARPAAPGSAGAVVPAGGSGGGSANGRRVPQAAVAPAGVRALRVGFAVAGRVAPRATGRLACRVFTRPRQLPAPPREQDWLAGTRPVRVAGLAGVELGSGPLVVLVHGWGGRPGQLGAFLAPLAATGHRAVALSLPAHGGSEGRTTDPVDTAGRLHDAVAVLGPALAVVGHSFGAGAIGIALARGLPAERVALLAAPVSLEAILADFVAQTALPARAAGEFRRTMQRRAGADAAALDLAALAPAMTAPALFLHDPHDPHASFSAAAATAAKWPGARLLPTPGMGHYRLLRDPAVVRATVDWINTPVAAHAVGTASPAASRGRSTCALMPPSGRSVPVPQAELLTTKPPEVGVPPDAVPSSPLRESPGPRASPDT